jgi:biotin transporter BioY
LNRDRTFLIVIFCLFGFMVMFGIGVTILALFGNPSQTLSLRVLGAIGSMFSAVVGLVIGYLVGRRNGQNGVSK